jgi:hypothetical protein
MAWGGKGAAAAAGAAAAQGAPAGQVLSPGLAFSAATYLVVPVYALMICAPNARLVSLVPGQDGQWAEAVLACSAGVQPYPRSPDQTVHQYPTAVQTRTIVDGPLLPLLLGAAYLVLGWQAWQAGLVQQVLGHAAPGNLLPGGGGSNWLHATSRKGFLRPAAHVLFEHLQPLR